MKIALRIRPSLKYYIIYCPLSLTWFVPICGIFIFNSFCQALCNVSFDKCQLYLFIYIYKKVLVQVRICAIIIWLEDWRNEVNNIPTKQTLALLKLQWFYKTNKCWIPHQYMARPWRWYQPPHLTMLWQSAFVESPGTEPKLSCCSEWRVPHYIHNTW